MFQVPQNVGEDTFHDVAAEQLWAEVWRLGESGSTTISTGP